RAPRACPAKRNTASWIGAPANTWRATSPCACSTPPHPLRSAGNAACRASVCVCGHRTRTSCAGGGATWWTGYRWKSKIRCGRGCRTSSTSVSRGRECAKGGWSRLWRMVEDGPTSTNPRSSTILHQPRLAAVPVKRPRQVRRDVPRRPSLAILPFQLEHDRAVLEERHLGRRRCVAREVAPRAGGSVGVLAREDGEQPVGTARMLER